MATLSIDMHETEPLLPHNGNTDHDAEAERSLQPPGDIRLFCSLLIDSIPGLSFFEFYSIKPDEVLLNIPTVILSYMLQNSIQAVSILIAARLGPGELSAASVALMLAFVTGEFMDCLLHATMIPPPVIL